MVVAVALSICDIKVPWFVLRILTIKKWSQLKNIDYRSILQKIGGSSFKIERGRGREGGLNPNFRPPTPCIPGSQTFFLPSSLQLFNLIASILDCCVISFIFTACCIFRTPTLSFFTSCTPPSLSSQDPLVSYLTD